MQFIDSSTLEGINTIRILLENWLHSVLIKKLFKYR